MLRSTRRMARYLLKRLSKPRRMSPGRVESGEAFRSTVTRSENQAQSLRALLSARRTPGDGALGEHPAAPRGVGGRRLSPARLGARGPIPLLPVFSVGHAFTSRA